MAGGLTSTGGAQGRRGSRTRSDGRRRRWPGLSDVGRLPTATAGLGATVGRSAMATAGLGGDWMACSIGSGSGARDDGARHGDSDGERRRRRRSARRPQRSAVAECSARRAPSSI
jgi:hypothetical protein